MMMAVPCWSSWNTGMSSCSISACFDLEAMRRGDVLQVDAAEGRGDAHHRLDEILRVLGLDLDIEYVDVGEMLEQHRLAFHHRLARQGAPTLPRPSTALPSVITATRLPLAVYL